MDLRSGKVRRRAIEWSAVAAATSTATTTTTAAAVAPAVAVGGQLDTGWHPQRAHDLVSTNTLSPLALPLILLHVPARSSPDRAETPEPIRMRTMRCRATGC